MNLLRLSIQFLFRPSRAAAFFGCVLVCLGLNPAVSAAEPPDGITQSNSVAAGSNSVVGTNAAPAPSPQATNGLNAAPVTNTAAAPVTNTAATATNLSETAATYAAPVLDDKYKLTIGDRLSLKILEDEEEPKSLTVTDSGDVEVPYVGRVSATNKTCRQLAADIKTEAENGNYYHATVSIAVDLMTKSHGRVYVSGQVRLPGPMEQPGDEVLTLSRAILRAGGFTDYAKRDKVQVMRVEATDQEAADKDAAGNEARGKKGAGKDDKKTNTKTFTRDVGQILDKGKMDLDLPLENGDFIIVPDRLLRF